MKNSYLQIFSSIPRNIYFNSFLSETKLAILKEKRQHFLFLKTHLGYSYNQSSFLFLSLNRKCRPNSRISGTKTSNNNIPNDNDSFSTTSSKRGRPKKEIKKKAETTVFEQNFKNRNKTISTLKTKIASSKFDDKGIFEKTEKEKKSKTSVQNSSKKEKNPDFSKETGSELTEKKALTTEIDQNIFNLLSQTNSKFVPVEEKKLITISLASSELIRQWAETKLPNGKVFGQVLNADTLHYKTLKPIKGGLFCERIFGPIKDFQCACGIQKQKPNRILYSSFEKKNPNKEFCPECDVEYTWSDKRRYQLGYLQLATPVPHMWYFKSQPSTISILLGADKRDIEDIVYCARMLTLDAAWKHNRLIYFDSPIFLKKSNSFLKSIKKEKKTINRNSLISKIENNRQKRSLILNLKIREKSKSEDSSIRLKQSFIGVANSENFFKTSFYIRNNYCLQRKQRKSRMVLNMKKKAHFAEEINSVFSAPFDYTRSFEQEQVRRKSKLYQSYENSKNQKTILRNNISCLSHRETWEPEFLNLLLYYIWPIEDPRDILIPIYKNCILNKTFSSSFAPLHGGGILAPLLAECNAEEFPKIITVLKKKVQNITDAIIFTQLKIESATGIKFKKLKKTLKDLRNLLKICLERIQYFKTAYLPSSFDLFNNIYNSSSLFEKKDFFNLVTEFRNKANRLTNENKSDKNSSESQSETNLKIKKQSNQNLEKEKFSTEWLFISCLPVLPPNLRPILQIQDQIIATDLNRLYQKVINRNERVQKFLKDSATNNSLPIRLAQKSLQEAVDNLIENGKGGTKPEIDNRGRPLKSLGDLLKGKKGRFRQNLLGKRVDYSGRSVIVVGPKLQLNQCGLPKEMAAELFMPFLIKELLSSNAARTIAGAKKIIDNNPTLTFSHLKKVVKNHIVLLNRAPTLHRVSFQAFRPVLVDGRAILIHPLVCPAFNADFDGDQMAVHLPITPEARAEAWKFMLSHNNILSTATGEPAILPSQDMVLGCYYLTTLIHNMNKKTEKQIVGPEKNSNRETRFSWQIHEKAKYFSTVDQVLKAYERNLVSIHTNIWVKFDGLVQTDSFPQGRNSVTTLELRIRPTGHYSTINSDSSSRVFDSKLNRISQIIRTTPGRVLFNFILNKTRT